MLITILCIHNKIEDSLIQPTLKKSREFITSTHSKDIMIDNSPLSINNTMPGRSDN